MKTLFLLASVMVVLFLVAPSKITAQKRKATKPRQSYVLNDSRARVLVEDFVNSRGGNIILAGTPDFAKDLNAETIVNYMTDEPQRLTVETAFLRDLARAGLLNVNSRSVSITNVTGEYERQSTNGSCPYHIKIRHGGRGERVDEEGNSPQSPLVSGSATYRLSLYRKCDYGPHKGDVSGEVDESGSIGLKLPTAMSSEYYYFTLVNGTLEPKGAGVWEGLPNSAFRRTTGDVPPIIITKYKYSLTDEAKALGLTARGGNVKIGEMTIDNVSGLLLHGETNATGRAKFSIKYNKLRAVLLPSGVGSGTFPVSFGQTPERKWVVVR